MKRLLAAFAALLVAAPAFGQAQTSYIPFTKTHQDSTKLHVAWIEDDFGLQNNTDALQKNYMRQYHEQLGNFKEMLIKGGVEVHTYTYSFFNSQGANTNTKWRDMGLPRSQGGGGYGVAFMPGWYGVAASSGSLQRAVRDYSRYWRACSTSVQLIHFGFPNAMTWTDGYGVRDSSLGHGCSGGGGEIAYNTNTPTYRFPRVSATGDTFPLRSQVFRLSAPSTSYFPPNTNPVRLFSYGAQTDSTWAANDTLVIAWKMRSTTQGHSLSTTPTAYFVVGGQSNTGNTSHARSAAPVAWALISRFVRLPTIPQVFALNHVGLFGGTHIYRGTRVASYASNTSPWLWPRPGAIDSQLVDMRRNYNVRHITIGTQADSAAAAWALGYSKNVAGGPAITWSLHFHTSDSSSALASIHSRSWDAQNDSIYNADRSFRRVAFRLNAYNPSPYKRYGIYQTIVKSDSIFRANGATPANYMQPGNNFMMGPNAISANDWPTTPDSNAVAGRDSTFEAFAQAGKTLFCGSGYEGVQVGARASAGNWEWNPLPEETYTTASGKQLRFSQYYPISSLGIVTFGATNGALTTNPGSTATAITTIGTSTAQLFGIYATVPIAPVAFGYGQTTNSQGVNSVTGRSRGRESHATFWGNENHGFYIEYQAMKWNVFMPIKALESIAGHELIEWATPEMAWSRY